MADRELHKMEDFLVPMPQDMWIERSSCKSCMVCNTEFGEIFREGKKSFLNLLRSVSEKSSL